jgi:hypothetical protein
MPRYVVLHHTGYDLPHYDLMLAMDDVSPLLTWRLYNWPPKFADMPTQIGDHRREYLTYEGPVSNNRGDVRRVAEGDFELVHDSPTLLRIHLKNNDTVIELPKA